MNSSTVLTFSLVCAILASYSTSLSSEASCESCGKECLHACGTVKFRTCCLNYLRKRSEVPPIPLERGPEFLMVLSELAENYPSLRHLISDIITEEEMKGVLLRLPQKETKKLLKNKMNY